jgi:putative ABC transport system ATP-binding protein
VSSVLQRGIALSPELTRGLAVTLLLALLSTIGRVLVPVAVQQTIDHGIRAPGGPRPGLVLALASAAAAGLVVTAASAFTANRRIFRATEAGLATLRTKAFRHVHDLSVLSQNTERRGALVARVTTDVDTISTFVQWGGLLLVTSAGQLLVATLLMVVYSWPLALLVWACFLPLLLAFPALQRIVSRAYAMVRERVGDMLGAVSESVVGADTIRAYALERRTQARIDAAVQAHASSAIRAQKMVALSFSSGVLVSGLVVAAVVGVGTALGVNGRLTLGELVAFLFLVQLFTGPVQMGTEVLNELQNAAAGWRRVLAVLDTPADVSDPADRGVQLPRGPISVRFDHVRFAYPGGPDVLRDVDLDLPPRARIAVVGETGSGKTTMAKLLTRLMDPTEGRILVDGVDLRDVRFSSLRERVVLVPQEGFLVDDTLRANIAWGGEHRADPARGARREVAGRDDVVLALTELGLLEWAEQLPHGLDTHVGQGDELALPGRQRHPWTDVRGHRAPAVDGRGRGPRRRGGGRGGGRRGPAPRPRRAVTRVPAPARQLGHPATPVGPVGSRGRGDRRGGWEDRRVTQGLDAQGSGADAGEGLDPQVAARLKRDGDGLVCAVVQQHDTREVLMVGWMDDEALHRTLSSGRVTFWSRSRQEYWRKGDTSGHVQWVRAVALDCDGDALLVQVDQVGAACHTGTRTCFEGRALDAVVLEAAR